MVQVPSQQRVYVCYLRDNMVNIYWSEPDFIGDNEVFVGDYDGNGEDDISYE